MSDAAHPRLLEVEGLRGLAALGVLTYHVGQLTDGDGWLEWLTQRFWLGVPMFFVLTPPYTPPA